MAVIGRQDINSRLTAAFPAGLQQAKRLLGGQHARLAPRLVEGGLALLLGLLAALIALQLFAPLPLPQGNPLAAASQQPAGAAAPVVVKNPFPAAPAGAAFQEQASTVAETTLDLTLTGVWADENGGSATIETPDGKQERFAVGDEIVNGVRLESVYADRVIINRSGVREALRFESKTASVTQTPSPPLRQAPPSPTPPARTGGVSDILRLAPGTDAEGNFYIDVYAARNRAAFNGLGFRDGDRVVSINGEAPPSNPAALGAVLGMLQRQSEAVIVVKRGEREIPVTISLEGLGNR